MAISRTTIFRALALLAGGAACFGAATLVAQRMEAKTEETVRAHLSGQGFDWTEISADGLVATIHGTAPDEAARFRALTSAGEVISPANILDGMTVAAQTDFITPAYRLEFIRNGRDLTLHGLMPGDQDAEASLLALLGATIDNPNLSELITATGEDAPDGWSEALQTAIEALLEMENARVVVEPGKVGATGLVQTRLDASNLRRELAATAGDAVELALELKLPRPIVSPFTTRFRIDDQGARFEACVAESDAGLARIRVAAEAAGATDSSTCRVALGAPDPSWGEAVSTGLTALAEMGEGTITFSDLTVTLFVGENVEAEDADTIANDLEGELPTIYSLTLLTPDTGEDTSPARTLSFTATISPEGLTVLRGAVPDAQSLDAVESLASARFGTEDLDINVRPDESLPLGWSVKVLAGLNALSTLNNGALRVTADRISLNGMSYDEDAQASIAGSLSDALGPDVHYELDIAHEDRPEPVNDLPTPEECVAQVNEQIALNKITFDPGSIELNASGYETVGQIATVLRKCPQVPMEISGHTDSQGREELNQQLSQARADAVLNALMARRVLVGNLSAKGYGENEPIADNDTEEGRETNRRIEFRLTPTEEEVATEGDEPLESDGEAGSETENQPEAEDGQN
ncbi:OmpA family protein [Qingshengfaniella alkalisoli]|uniref:OmpA family protein n=1 Tax=Qingshengfaniella alkalisoli TaxID=2599296 RepID=A0A5B8IU41_9RHOB|nr:OmpA family protein [Qingshengfaniella alkalisoli]QDY69692.1 OmpA family protein [Qingshengfaniella alkalisoli]